MGDDVTSTDSTLIAKPKPTAGESLNGFIARICQENWFSRVVMLERIAGISVPKVALEAGGLGKLAALLGQDEQALVVLQYSPVNGDGTQRQFMGHAIHHSHLRTTAMRYCPVCLGTRGFHQAVWDLRLIGACPEHGVRLTGEDPRTGKEISWVRPDLLGTQYNDLPVADTLGHKRELSEETLVGQRAIYEKCGIGHGGDPVLRKLHRDFGEMELDEFFKMMIVLASSKLDLPYISGARGIYAGGVDVLELTSAGAGMMIDWPKGLVDYLERQREQATPNMAGAGLSKIFETLFKRMKKLKDGPAKELLQHAIKDYLTERPISFNPKNANFVRGDERAGWSYVTLKEAAEILCVSTYRARGIAVEQGWVETNKKTKHITNLIPRALVDAYREPEASTLSHTDAMALLGITKGALGPLIKEKVVVPRPNKVDGRSDTRFIAAELESLLSRLRACSDCGMPVGNDVEELDVRELSRRISPPSYSIGALLALVLDGTLQPLRWAEEAEGVYAVRFNASKVAEYKGAVNAKRPPTIKAASASSRYGYTLKELAWLVNLQLLKVVHHDADFRQSALSTVDLQKVTDHYVLERKADQRTVTVADTPAAEHPELGRLFKVV